MRIFKQARSSGAASPHRAILHKSVLFMDRARHRSGRTTCTAQRRRVAERRIRSDSELSYLEIRLAKRRLMFRDPDLSALKRILFVKRHPYLSSHNYSDVLDFQFSSGGGICVVEIPKIDGRMKPAQARRRTLFDASRGIARDPMAIFDGGTLYFACRADAGSGEATEPFWHLMSVNTDGSNVRQLTDGPFHDYYP